MVDAVKIIKCGDRKADKLKNSIGEMVNDATKPLEESLAEYKKLAVQNAEVIVALGQAVAALTEDAVKRNKNQEANNSTMKSIDNNLKQIKNEIRYLRHRNDRIQKEKEDLP